METIDAKGQACPMPVVRAKKELAEMGMTMVVVTHEMAFARDISSHVIFMADGLIAEEGTAKQIFENPAKQETREFLSRFRNE